LSSSSSPNFHEDFRSNLRKTTTFSSEAKNQNIFDTVLNEAEIKIYQNPIFQTNSDERETSNLERIGLFDGHYSKRNKETYSKVQYPSQNIISASSTKSIKVTKFNDFQTSNDELINEEGTPILETSSQNPNDISFSSFKVQSNKHQKLIRTSPINIGNWNNRNYYP
jgi:hypothetical protein